MRPRCMMGFLQEAARRSERGCCRRRAHQSRAYTTNTFIVIVYWGGQYDWRAGRRAKCGG